MIVEDLIRNPREFVKKVVEYRFKIIGGRLRFLLSRSDSIESLKKMLSLAISQLKVDDLVAISGIDISNNEKSICYTICPNSKGTA